jgi:Ser-tRNA(Ala) deacylase AlaX
MLGNAKVEYVRFINGEIIHQIKGNVSVGNMVKEVLDWDYRYKYMKIHSAGHLLHDVLMTMVKDLTPIKGGHGKKAFIEYKGEVDPFLKEKIETGVNNVTQKGLAIVTKFVSYDELVKQSQFLPPHLPKNKPLRILKIGDFPLMPDGGVQVKNTKEIGKIWISSITVQGGNTIIRYGVAEII